MALAAIIMTALTAVGVVGFGIAGLVDSQRRRQEQHNFLTGTIRKAVFHTASMPVRSDYPHRLRVQPLPLLTQSRPRLMEDSGIYPVA